jgi:hypothetical protein
MKLQPVVQVHLQAVRCLSFFSRARERRERVDGRGSFRRRIGNLANPSFVVLAIAGPGREDLRFLAGEHHFERASEVERRGEAPCADFAAVSQPVLDR